MTNTATFTWTQPPGDPAAISGYTWKLDRTPDTVLHGFNLGPTTTKTYRELVDGVWYMHVRAVSDGKQWSETAHRAIRVDVNPPRVQLAVDPGQPSGDNGWYVTPITVTVSAAVGSWPGQPPIEVKWVFTATHELGAGNHIFLGRAQDVAGNQEAPYETARVLWYPKASLDIAGSSLAASPATWSPSPWWRAMRAGRRRTSQSSIPCPRG